MPRFRIPDPAASTAIEYGENVVLTAASSGLPTPCVQWYRGSSGDISQPVSGATSATFVSKPLTLASSFWALVSNLSGSADSTTAAVAAQDGTTTKIYTVTVKRAPAPTVIKPGADGINDIMSEAQATLIGIVNPRGSQTDVRFEYGTDPNSQDSFTTFQDIGSGTRVVEVTAAPTASKVTPSASATARKIRWSPYPWRISKPASPISSGLCSWIS